MRSAIVPSELLPSRSYPRSHVDSLCSRVVLVPRALGRGVQPRVSMALLVLAEQIGPPRAKCTHPSVGSFSVVLFGRVSLFAAIPQEEGCCSDCVSPHSGCAIPQALGLSHRLPLCLHHQLSDPASFAPCVRGTLSLDHKWWKTCIKQLTCQ